MKARMIFLVIIVNLVVFSCKEPTKSNLPPECTITKPNSNAEFVIGEQIEINVTASDEDGEIEETQFYFDEELENTDKTDPFSYTLETTNLNPGEYKIKCKVLDDDGKGSISEKTINVVEPKNIPPTCTITNPTNNQDFQKGDIIVVRADVEDENDNLEEVRFYIDNNLHTTFEKGPYEYEINTKDLSSGQHKFKMKAIDSDSESETAEVTIAIKEPSPESYDGISNSLYNEIYFENFSDDQSAWSEGSYEGGTRVITDGYYEINNSSETQWLFWLDMDEINSDKDFEIEVDICLTENNTGASLFWGSYIDDNNTELFLYEIWSMDGLGSSIYNDDGENVGNLIDIVNSNYLNNIDSFNTLTVRKYNNEYYFFMNENYLGSSDFVSFYGSYLGFSVFSESIVRIDNIKVSQIKETSQSLGKRNTEKTLKTYNKRIPFRKK